MKKNPLFRPKTNGGPRFDGNSHIKAMYKHPDWVHYSKKYLEINNKCYCCGKLSQAVDHIIPHKGNVVRFQQLDNHLPLCFKCHNTCTALFDRYAAPKTEDKMKWIARMREKFQLTFKVFVLPSYPIKSR